MKPNDDRLVFDRFDTVLKDIATEFSYCGMMALSGISAALSVPIQSYCPPTQDDDTAVVADISDNGTVDYDKDEADDYDDDAVDKDGHFVSTESDILPGGKSLPLGKFLETEKVIEILQRTSVNDTLSEVPRGKKDGVYFVVQNENNKDRRTQGKRSQFWEDRGACECNSTSRSYYYKKMKNCGQLLIDKPNIVFSDDEKAQKLAMALAFPQAPSLTYTRHLKQNFSHTVAGKVGLPSQERQRFITQIFGDNSIIAHGTDHMDIAYRLQHMDESTENRFVQKLIELMSPLLVENAKGLERPGLHLASPLWTNNNCKSLNHCLKQALSWRSLKLVELVQKLHSIIKTQHREVQRAVCGVGEFVLLMNIRGLVYPKMCGIPTLENNKNDT
ncbi:hypothetical protein PoB_000117600 [Plakobranchus ocellatus]|uniref:Uncharacterized protein n=1 Tax=Plakobranchus ocellatus TaxID=259542 RepID=A0AAV3XV53_9GAST|nr:hypothetical protein PoB_000117600 [Plakobranchus ocellatus]